jgi:chromosome segregation protein
MHLKSLEIIGFKSFADKTRLDFHPGATAIVGPNGCGKSNVLDAIRWVLGEQSAKALRGGEMADVIFNGTENRKPTSMAEVSMTFTDCARELGVEYREVRLTRRLFRDGTSEYEMNRNKVRLRDIHHLFMDTGIGRSAYSIMEQGKIDKILSARPEDRREVFEEAAGITKFKSQKKEALRKLEHTEANLLRISDIVKEVKRQIGSLQRQAAKARRYREIWDELRELDTRWAKHQFADLVGQLAVIEGEQKERDAKIEELSVQIGHDELSLQEHRAGLLEFDRKLEQGRAERAELRSVMERAEGRIGFNRERVADSLQTDEQARGEIASVTERLGLQREQLEQLRSEAEQTSVMLNEARERTSVLNGQYAGVSNRRAQWQREILALEQELLSVGRQVEQLQNALQARDSDKRAFALRLETAETELGLLRSGVQQLEQEMEGGRARSAETEVARNEGTEVLEQARQRAKDAVAALDKARREREMAARSVAEITSKRDLLERMERQHEGFSQAVRRVLEASGQGGSMEQFGIHQTLSDLLEVSPEDAPVITALLGERIEALVIADPGAVSGIIEFLAGGEARTLCLAPLQAPRIVWQSALERPEAALHFVRIQDQAQSLFQSLLGNAYICADLASAQALKNELPHATVASRDGHILTGEGLVLTYVVGRSTSPLERRRELAALIEQASLAETENQRCIAVESDAVRLRDEAEWSVESARTVVREREEASSSARRDLQVLERQIQDIRNKIASQESTIRGLVEADRRGEERFTGQIQEREAAQVRRAEIETRLSAMRGELPALSEEESRVQAQVMESRIEVASIEGRQTGLQSQLGPLQVRVREFEERLVSLDSVLESNARRRSDLEAEIERLSIEVAEAQVRASVLDEELSATQAERAQVAETLNVLEQAARGQREELARIQSARAQLQIQHGRITLQVEHLRERIGRAYQVNLDELLSHGEPTAKQEVGEAIMPGLEPEAGPELPPASPSEDPAPDWGSVAARVSELQAKLDSMGPVNIEAIAEYEELEARHTFLETQHNDLVQSKAQLMEAIQRINNTTRELFSETFERIRINFQGTYQELFGGGRANLILADEQDPLECGIEIVAKPPGKQPQSITLLSGGERAMTAVALLFAIYMVKPSPFCVLDEMDAPLDESNIGRFLTMLERFVHQSQFLIITHHKKTMGFADALYGVTMEEKGVSKTVSVRFNQREIHREPPPEDISHDATEDRLSRDLHDAEVAAEEIEDVLEATPEDWIDPIASQPADQIADEPKPMPEDAAAVSSPQPDPGPITIEAENQDDAETPRSAPVPASVTAPVPSDNI